VGCILRASVQTYRAQGNYLSLEQGHWDQVWPPAQMADFVIGALAAAIAQRQIPSTHASAENNDTEQGNDPRSVVKSSKQRKRQICLRGFLADVSVAIIVAVVLFLPYHGYRVGWEPLLNHVFAPCYAAFLYGSAANGGAGCVAGWLQNKSLVILGAYSFEVYLFQWPIHEIWVAIGDITKLFDMRPGGENWNMEGFMIFFLSLWTFAGWYAKSIEAPLIQWLRDITAEKVAPKEVSLSTS